MTADKKFQQFLDALENLAANNGTTAEKLWRGAVAGERGAAAIVSKVASDIGVTAKFLQDMTGGAGGPFAKSDYQFKREMAENRRDRRLAREMRMDAAGNWGNIDEQIMSQLEKKGLVERVPQYDIAPGDVDVEGNPIKVTDEELEKILMGKRKDKYPSGIFSLDPEYITYGTGREKDKVTIATNRARLAARGEVDYDPSILLRGDGANWDARVGNDLVSPVPVRTSSLEIGPVEPGQYFPRVSKLTEDDWQIAYVRARQSGLSDVAAAKYAQYISGETDPLAYGKTWDPGEQTQHRRMLSEQQIMEDRLYALNAPMNRQDKDNPKMDLRDRPVNYVQSNLTGMPVHQESWYHRGDPIQPEPAPATQTTVESKSPEMLTSKGFQEVARQRGRKAMRWGPGHTAGSLLGLLAATYGLSELYDYS